MSSQLELKVIFAAVDKFVRPVKGITAAASEAAKALRDNTARMKEFDRTVSQIDAFKKAEKEAAITANTFKATTRQIDELKAAIGKAGVPTKAMSDELAKLTKRSEELKAKHQALTTTEQALFGKLKEAGVDTRNLAEQRRNLASASAEAANASKRLQAALDAENQKMRKVRAAQAELDKSKALAGKLASAGAGIAAGGAAISLPVGKAVSDYASFETAMLGVARQMNDARDANGKVTKTYWEMGDAIKAISERLPGTSADIAKIVESGARMGIQGKENLLTYAETTAVMAKAFDLPVDQVGESIGKISQLYKVPIKDIKSLGDTINWLDDNALAKGGDIIDVMQRIAGTADMVKMNFKEAAALGSTFLSLGARPEVAASASNAMIRELSIAKMQGKRFQGGMDMLGLNSADIQASMSKDATGTIIKVLEKIKSLSGDKQLEAATRIFGKEFGDDAAKLASNLDEYRRQLNLVRDEKAFGSMQREANAWADTLDARISNAKDAFSNLSSDLGQHLKPAIADTLDSTLSMVQAVRDWGKEHPQLSSALMTSAKWLALILGVVGALGVAAGGILVPLAMLKFSMKTLEIGGGPIASALGSIAGRIWAIVSPIGKLTAAFAAGYAAGTLLSEGIDWALSKILGYETTLGGSTYDLVQAIKSNFSRLLDWFGGLPDRMRDSGREMLAGLMAGIDEKWDALKSKVTGIADSTVSWIREKLGIHSPSRVFAEIGDHMMAGWSQGIENGDQGPLSALSSATKKLIAAGAVVGLQGMANAHQTANLPNPPEVIRSISDRHNQLQLDAPTAAIRQIIDSHQTANLPNPPDALRKIINVESGSVFRNSPTTALAQTASSSTHAGSTYQITIQAPAGTDNQGLADLVAREIERIEARKAARHRGRLTDSE